MSEVMGDEEGAVIAFIASLANINLRPPKGANAGQWQSKRLREIRNAANHVMANQFDELALTIAKMIIDGSVVYTGDGISTTKGTRQ